MQDAPVRLHRNVREALGDARLAAALAGVRDNFIGKRARAVAAYEGGEGEGLGEGAFEALREYGRGVRAHAVAHMPALLREFADNAAAAGTRVLWAKDGAEARRLVAEIAARHEVRAVVKSKSMVSEEVGLNAALEAVGAAVTETDLGEFIIQLAGERPSHIIAPAVHKSRAEVSALFERHLGVQTDDIAALARAARAHLRERFFVADMGITGANFLAADTGAAVIVTNEGNGRMSNTLPRVHVVLAGIDKVVARHADLPHLLTLLTHSATGQRLSNYVSVTAGARRGGGGGEGPAHAYVVLVDNGRSAMRGGAYAEMLRCIRCGACMNHCPVYHHVGGHAYGSVYVGPMGQVLTPALQGIAAAPDLPFAATLCGACEVVCPVKIPLPALMRRLRAERVRVAAKPWDRALVRMWCFFALRPRVYGVVVAVLAWVGGRLCRLGGGRWGRWVPGLKGWCAGRVLPVPASVTFRQWLRRRGGGDGGGGEG